MNNKLTFGLGNSKLPKYIATFSIPAGHTCPFAKECLSKTDRITGKLTDGKHCKFRCYAASEECTYKVVRESRWKNYDNLLSAGSSQEMANLIQSNLLKGINIIRVHVSGDFFNEEYFIAWLNVALNNPDKIFYGYTKALPFLIKYKKHLSDNFRFTASYGGTLDSLISLHKLRFSKVMYSIEQAVKEKLPLDHDDSLSLLGKRSFGLLIHGVQPGNSKASKAVQLLKKNGIFGYGKKPSSKQVKNAPKINMIVPFVKIKTLPKNEELTCQQSN